MAILTSMKEEKTEGGGFKVGDMLPGGFTDFLLESGALQIEYFLEEKIGQKSTLVPLPAQPQNVLVRRIYSENPIYTFEQKFAYREIARPRIVEVQLQGQTGSNLRLGLDENGQVTYQKGPQHLQNFEKFLDKYHFHAASHATPIVYSIQSVQNDLDYESRPYLIFRGIKENLHGRCHITDFSYQRSVQQHRIESYQWALTLRIYDTAEADDPTRFEMMKSLDKATNAVNQITGLSESFQRSFQAGFGQVMGGVGDVFESVVGLSASVGRIDNTIYGSLALVTTAAGKVISAFDAIGSLFDGDAYLADFDQAADGFTKSTVDNWQRRKFFEAVTADRSRASTDQWNKAPGTPKLEVQRLALTASELLYQSWLLLGPIGMDSSNRSLTDIHGFLGREYGFSALALMHADRQYTPAADLKDNVYNISYEMRPGQSLLTLANSFLGNPNRWNELASLNDASDAYTKSDGTPFQAGDTILIPAAIGDYQGQNIDLTKNTDAEAIIGTDISFVNGDIFFRNEDIGVVSGADNLKQAIEMSLKTATDEVTMDPRYGAKVAIIGSKINTISSALIATRVREQLLRDSRILDVINFSIELDPNYSDTLNLTLTCVCIGQNDIVVNTDLPTG